MVYPRSEETLSIFQIVADWSNSGTDRPPSDRILGQLLQAFWLNELPIFSPGSEKPACRSIFLRGLRRDPGDLIVFGEPGAAKPAEPIELPDGSIAIDVAHHIPLLPCASQSERPAIYECLAEIPVSDYPATFLQAFRTHYIRRDDLAILCDSRNWRRPSFWFRSPTSHNSTKSNDVLGCRRFLGEVFASSVRRSKDQIWEEAKRQFLSLSRNAFDGVWAESAPPSWRKGGRRRAKQRTGFPV